jgi:adenylate kinase family enzyme
MDRIYITGAPGCGVTTLGRALADRIGAPAIDIDDHYWERTDPPYQVKLGVKERLRRIGAEQARTGRWVVSGSLETWGAHLVAEAQLIVFLEAPTELRLARLRRRESERFGDAILPGGALFETHRYFLEWTADYELGTRSGRSRPRQEEWLATVPNPILRLDAAQPTEALMAEALAFAASG